MLELVTAESDVWAVCPKCGKSHVEVCGGRSTCMYFPLIIEDGKAKPSGHNVTTLDLRCLECGHRWTVGDEEANAQKAVSAEAIAEKQAKPHILEVEAESGGYEAAAVDEDRLKGLAYESGVASNSVTIDADVLVNGKSLMGKLEALEEKLGEILEILKGKPDRTLHG